MAAAVAAAKAEEGRELEEVGSVDSRGVEGFELAGDWGRGGGVGSSLSVFPEEELWSRLREGRREWEGALASVEALERADEGLRATDSREWLCSQQCEKTAGIEARSLGLRCSMQRTRSWI